LVIEKEDTIMGDDIKCEYTVTGNCEDCSLPAGEDCPYVNDDDEAD